MAIKITGRRNPARMWRITVYAATYLLALGWTTVAGKDLNWDTINYHLYAGYSALNDRSQLDFMAAGLQSYFNPYAHVPFYWMVRAGMPSILIGGVLASIQTVTLLLTYELAVNVIGRRESNRSQALAIAAALLAFLNPVFLQLLGSTFVDSSTAAFVLAAYLAIVFAFRTKRRREMVVAGLLIGAATALKLSNAVFLVAAIPGLVLLPVSPYRIAGCILLFGVSAMVGGLLCGGTWAWGLWDQFGNPLFPLLNQYFNSPDLTAEPFKDNRFLPTTLGQALAQPFRMVLPQGLLHTEPPAPDLRYAFLAAALATLMVRLGVRVAFRTRRGGEAASTFSSLGYPLQYLAVSFVTGWILWLMVSGNSRYFIPMSCIASVLLVALVGNLACSRVKVLGYLLGSLIALQFTQLAIAGQARWNANPWGGPWFDLSIPDRLRSEPFLYLTADSQSASFLLPFLAPGSGLINIGGAIAIGPDGPGGARVQEMIDRRQNDLRALVEVSAAKSGGDPSVGELRHLGLRVQAFGLAVDSRDCAYIDLEGRDSIQLEALDGALVMQSLPRTRYLTCRLTVSPVDAAAHRIERTAVDRVFDRVERACPDIFQPRFAVSEKRARGWRRSYVNTDIVLWALEDRVVFQNTIKGGDPIDIGSFEAWLAGDPDIDCTHRYAPAFNGIGVEG